jgi:hypothetical protein
MAAMSHDMGKELVLDTFKQFFDSWSSKAFDVTPTFCHPNAMLFVKSSEVPPRTFAFIKQLPDFVSIRLKSVEEVVVADDAIASVLLEYEMLEEHEGQTSVVGVHKTFFSMMKVDGVWTITGSVDYGVEV